VSVGHVARVFEEAGIPTVVIMSGVFAHRARTMRMPRVVLTPHIMARPLGAPHDVARQRAVLDTALDLLANAPGNGTIVEFPEPYRPGPGS